jgi:Na+/proline symporter
MKAVASQILIQKTCVIESDLFGRCVMDRTTKLLLNVGGIAIVAIVGAMLMMAVDLGGTRWLKFLLYVAFFASISSPAVFSSSYSCSSLLRRMRKRS